jgi:hypothetical protein
MPKKKFCQSCSMPLDGKDNGTEKDGSLSHKYCAMCYDNGALRDPEMTLEEMTKIVDKALKDQGWGRIRRWLARGYLPRLERWKKP